MKIKMEITKIEQKTSKVGNSFYIIEGYAHLGNRYPDKFSAFSADAVPLAENHAYEVPVSLTTGQYDRIELKLQFAQATPVK